MTNEKPPWGYQAAVPETTMASWGARLIISGGYADLLQDRQGCAGYGPAITDLLAHINRVKPLNNLNVMLKERTVQSDVAEEVTVYEDETVKVMGNSNASHGYFYIAAWLK